MKKMRARFVVALYALSFGVNPSAGFAASDREVTINADGVLTGALRIPDKLAMHSWVIMIGGSGPTDRDGNSPKVGVYPNTLKLLAEGLEREGVASLRFDKRGVGASSRALASESDLTIGKLVQDVEQWAQFAQAQPGADCVVLLGHSEGALLATLAAKDIMTCGVVLISGAGRPAFDVMISQLAGQPMPEALRSQLLQGLSELKSGHRVENVPAPLMPLLRPSVQPYLISWFAVDPATELTQLKVPVLILSGSTDIQITAADTQRLIAAKPDAENANLEGVNHILKRAPLDRQKNIETYKDPNLPLDPRVISLVSQFVRSHKLTTRGP